MHLFLVANIVTTVFLGKRLRSIARSAKKTKPEDKARDPENADPESGRVRELQVQQVEEYLKRIGGSAKLKALKSVASSAVSDQRGARPAVRCLCAESALRFRPFLRFFEASRVIFCSLALHCSNIVRY